MVDIACMVHYMVYVKVIGEGLSNIDVSACSGPIPDLIDAGSFIETAPPDFVCARTVNVSVNVSFGIRVCASVCPVMRMWVVVCDRVDVVRGVRVMEDYPVSTKMPIVCLVLDFGLLNKDYVGVFHD